MAIDELRVARFETAMRDLDLPTWLAVASYLRPYVGPSVVVLPSVFELMAGDGWTSPDEPRDTTTDMTDDRIVTVL